MLEKDLERELKKWREKRSRKPESPFPEKPAITNPVSGKDRRTVQVGGREIVVVKKSSRKG